MPRSPRINRRWAVPAAALVGVLAVGAVPQLIPSAGATTPDLPAISASDLLAKARTSYVSALSGQVELVSNLGLPSLSGLVGGGGTSLTDLASGTHHADVWYDGPDHLRIALPAPLAETDWIRNGDDLWSWDSTTQQAAHASLAPTSASGKDAPATEPPDPTGAGVPDVAQQTPSQFAQDLLSKVDPSTAVSVRTPRYVAGRPVYELVLAPRDAASTVGEAVISVDAATGLPLEVRITAKGATTPAFRFGFTHADFSKPAASEFTFSPPSGAHVVQVDDPTAMVLERRHRHEGAPAPSDTTEQAPKAPTVTSVGKDWTAVAVLSPGQLPHQLDSLLSSAHRVGTGASAGRLVTTHLVNVLLLDDGRILVAAVTPAALEAAATQP
jgi:outer membrane lipoprotein-sorting protein